MPMHSWGKIFWDRIHHQFKCKAQQNPTKDSWAIYKTIALLKKGNTVDDATDLQDVEEMNNEEEEEDDDDNNEEDEDEDDEEGEEEEDENESKMDNSDIDN